MPFSICRVELRSALKRVVSKDGLLRASGSCMEDMLPGSWRKWLTMAAPVEAFDGCSGRTMGGERAGGGVGRKPKI